MSEFRNNETLNIHPARLYKNLFKEEKSQSFSKYQLNSNFLFSIIPNPFLTFPQYF